MTPTQPTLEDMRVAIAEHLGWKKMLGLWWKRQSPSGQIIDTPDDLPDYPNDLNALFAVMKEKGVQWNNWGIIEEGGYGFGVLVWSAGDKEDDAIEETGLDLAPTLLTALCKLWGLCKPTGEMV